MKISQMEVYCCVCLTQGEKGVRGEMGERGEPGEEVRIYSLALKAIAMLMHLL